MRRGRPSIGARCREIRERLADFATDRLDAMATGEVQGHLLSCQACSKAFGELLMEEVASGTVPLRTPPHLPPLEWYDTYLHAGRGRFGTFWKSVRDAREAADGQAREWARTRAEEIARALDLLLPPAPLAPATMRARGALRPHGSWGRYSGTDPERLDLRGHLPSGFTAILHPYDPARLQIVERGARSRHRDLAGRMDVHAHQAQREAGAGDQLDSAVPRVHRVKGCYNYDGRLRSCRR